MSEVALSAERLQSPVGDLLVVQRDGDLHALEFADHAQRMRKLLAKRYGTFRLIEAPASSAAAAALEAYFDGELGAVADLSVDAGGTGFQRRVWSALRRIPIGTALTYREMAQRLGIPKAVRAVANANALNPVSIVVPCHRVIGSDGTLRGYSGGLARKRWLLAHEGVEVRTADEEGRGHGTGS